MSFSSWLNYSEILFVDLDIVDYQVKGDQEVFCKPSFQLTRDQERGEVMKKKQEHKEFAEEFIDTNNLTELFPAEIEEEYHANLISKKRKRSKSMKTKYDWLRSNFLSSKNRRAPV